MLSGGGKLIINDLAASGNGVVCSSDWKDGLFDVAWSEEFANNVVTASGDGSLQLWNTTKPEVWRRFHAVLQVNCICLI